MKKDKIQEISEYIVSCTFEELSELSEKYLARKFDISPSYLSREFKRQKKIQLEKFIHQIKLTRSIHLMFMQLTGRASLRDGASNQLIPELKTFITLALNPHHDPLLPMPTTYARPHFTKRCLKRLTSIAAFYCPNTNLNSKISYTALMRRSLT